MKQYPFLQCRSLGHRKSTPKSTILLVLFPSTISVAFFSECILYSTDIELVVISACGQSNVRGMFLIKGILL